jgi:hypothetical protein
MRKRQEDGYSVGQEGMWWVTHTRKSSGSSGNVLFLNGGGISLL